jgi:hypothetical protein
MTTETLASIITGHAAIFLRCLAKECAIEMTILKCGALIGDAIMRLSSNY